MKPAIGKWKLENRNWKIQKSLLTEEHLTTGFQFRFSSFQNLEHDRTKY